MIDYNNGSLCSRKVTNKTFNIKNTRIDQQFSHENLFEK